MVMIQEPTYTKTASKESQVATERTPTETEKAERKP